VATRWPHPRIDLAASSAGRQPSLCAPYFDNDSEVRLVYDLCTVNGLDVDDYAAIFAQARGDFLAGRGTGPLKAGQTRRSLDTWQFFELIAARAVGDPMPAFDRAAADGSYPPSSAW
jgi:hypothetical protein